MATPHVQRISEASKTAWPIVRPAYEATMRSMAELAGITAEIMPKVVEYVDRAEETSSSRRRKICEETVWALANTGWLRTGGERDVILAAKKWADADSDATVPEEDWEKAIDGLTKAVGALPEYMTRPQEVAS
jgi:hypothetical protein